MHAKRLMTVLLLALPLVAVGTSAALAQVTASSGVYIEPTTIETTFPFMIGDKTLPGGKYDIEQLTDEALIFRPAKGAPIESKVITRLAQPERPLVEPRVIFDKVGDTYYVSEVWIPGRDGFLLRGTKEPHTHHAVKGSKKK